MGERKRWYSHKRQLDGAQRGRNGKKDRGGDWSPRRDKVVMAVGGGGKGLAAGRLGGYAEELGKVKSKS